MTGEEAGTRDVREEQLKSSEDQCLEERQSSPVSRVALPRKLEFPRTLWEKSGETAQRKRACRCSLEHSGVYCAPYLQPSVAAAHPHAGLKGQVDRGGLELTEEAARLSMWLLFLGYP